MARFQAGRDPNKLLGSVVRDDENEDGGDTANYAFNYARIDVRAEYACDSDNGSTDGDQSLTDVSKSHQLLLSTPYGQDSRAICYCVDPPRQRR